VLEEPSESRLGWPRTIATAFALVLIAFAVWGFWTILFHPKGIDFVSFWAAGRMVVAGHPADAYNIVAHRRLELTAAADTGLMPFPYPPPFLLVIAPFALFSFPIAYMLWDLISGGFYLLAGRRAAPSVYVLANPPVLVACMMGQSSLLTSGMLILGLTSLETAPFAAGAALGLLIVKPHLALMLPIAMLAGRKWRVIAGAICSVTAALLVSLVVLGPNVFRGFLEILPTYLQFMQHGSWNWSELASPFAFMRYFGASASVSIIVQIAIAVAAGIITAIAWWWAWEEKVAIVAAASLLASAYLFTYDAIPLFLPAGVLIRQKRFRSLGVLWVLCTLPVLTGYEIYSGPNTISLACILSIVLMMPLNGPSRDASSNLTL